MGQRLLTLRIRPPRLTVLLDENAVPSEFVKVVRFLSQVWGGRYHSIIPVNPDQPDQLTDFRLGQFRPEFVFGCGLNDDIWAPAVHEACQPRQYVILGDEIASDVRKADRLNLLHSDQAIIARLKAKTSPVAIPRKLKLVTVDEKSPWSPYCAALLGVHHHDVNPKYFDDKELLGLTSGSEFVNVHIDFVESWQESWLDAGSFGLTLQHLMFPESEPTIVLVRDIIQDLCLFWNLRINSTPTIPSWTIPVPFDQAADPQLHASIKKWLLSFRKYGKEPNYCVVTSHSITQDEATPFMSQLQNALESSFVQHVDFENPKRRIPQVQAFEYTVTWPVDLQRNTLTITPPGPKLFTPSNIKDAWFIDLLKDNKTGRAIKDMQLPDSTIVPELLNSPCPPQVGRSIVPSFGDGIDSINIRCTSGKETIRLQIPSPEEVLEELLLEYGYEVLFDEKRSSYGPTIKRFGSLTQAGIAVSGNSGRILNLLRTGHHRLDQIKRSCQLGKGVMPQHSYLDDIDQFMSHDTERMKRVGKKRFEEYARNKSPEKSNVVSLLEHWAARQIVTRSWEIGPCIGCRQVSYVQELDIRKQILCPNCGTRISLKDMTRIGYSLTHPVARALSEGFTSVIQAGRFFRNMTSRGFFWVPGLKYKKGELQGDIDVLACCDGLLVFGECKTLVNTADESSIWDTVVGQFLELVAVAIECRGALVFLAAQVTEFPKAVSDKIHREVSGRIPYLLLNITDLETGHRSAEEGKEWPWLELHNVIPVKFPETYTARSPGVRQIKDGFGLYTKGG